jgi:thiol-disulfide isomerase/thioredoxin
MARRMLSILGVAAIAALALALVVREPIRQMLSARSVMSDPAPDSAAMHEFVAAGQQSAVRLAALWNTERIVPRIFVAGALRETPDDSPGYKVLLQRAVRTRDPDVMQPAFYGLLKQHRDLARSEALSLLSDSDPEVALLALCTLASAGDDSVVPHLIPLISSPNRHISVATQNTLLRITGETRFDHNVLDRSEREQAIRDWQSLLAATSITPTTLPLPSPIEPFAAPDLTFTTLDGKTVRLGDLVGRRVVVNFWATWCAPCLEEMPTLQALHRHYGDEVVLLGVCVDDVAQQSAPQPPLDERIRRILSERGVTYPNAIDTSGDAKSAAAAHGVPLTLLLGRDGKVYRRFTGPRELTDFRRMVDELP